MRLPARLASAAELLDLLFTFRKPADGIINDYMRSRRYIGSKDRRWIADTVWRVLRHYGRFVRSSPVLDGRRAVLLLLRMEGEDPATFLTGEPYALSPLTEEEKAFLAGLPETWPGPEAECPEWLSGDISREDLAALTEEAPLDLRVNLLKASRADVLAALRQEGIEAEETPLSPVGLRVKGRVPVTGTAPFADGWIDIQDEGSQIVSLMTRAEPGQTVMDWCAGAGGKTLALSAMMENRGTIYAADIDARRLKDLPERARRAGCRNVILLDGYAHLKKYDLVLVDAPCSGIGTWRRAPDARWRMTAESVAGLIRTQAEILEKAAEAVKPGGRLFYITCSLYREENEAQIERFLKALPEFEQEDLSPVFEALTGSEITGPVCRLSPSVCKTDGFFAASMKRRQSVRG